MRSAFLLAVVLLSLVSLPAAAQENELEDCAAKFAGDTPRLMRLRMECLQKNTTELEKRIRALQGKVLAELEAKLSNVKLKSQVNQNFCLHDHNGYSVVLSNCDAPPPTDWSIVLRK